MMQTPTSILPAIDRQSTINCLRQNGYPVLPVAPAQPANKYPATDKSGNVKTDREGNPLPAFTGKNPSYLDKQGKPHPINHAVYQKRLPTDNEIKTWFENPSNGLGTLGGWNFTIWIDFDVKQFDNSLEECDRAFYGRLEAHPALMDSWLEKTHSGGYRLAVKCKQQPDFTNFALEPGGKHRGEALGPGKFTVLSPTVGVSGNAYECMNRAVPVEIESLESIGIYPTRLKAAAPAVLPDRHTPEFIPGAIPLETLGTDESREVLQGLDIKGDRSSSLTAANREWYGWQNWAALNGISVSGTPEDLAHHAGMALGLDNERVMRIIKTIDPTECQPAALGKGGDEACWKKVHKLNRATFTAKCPAHIADRIKTEWSKGNASSRQVGNGATKEQILEAVDDRQSIAATIRELLEQDLSDAELQERQIKLCSEFGVSDRQLKNLWVKLEEERNFQETKGDRHQDLEKLLSIKDYSLPLKGVLHKSLAEPFEKVAGWIGSSPEALLTTLLPTIGSLAGAGTELMLMPATDFKALPILYTGIVAKSGMAKSPTQKMILKPLLKLQSEEEEAHEGRLKSWNDQCQKAEKDGEPKPDKPNVREFYTVDVTREGIALIQSQQPDRGFICVHDELSGLFNGHNAYKSGKGSDKEALLSARDGSPLKVNRASGKRISTLGSYHSISGGTQPDTLKKMMGDFDDGSGQWARFLWCLLPQKPAPYVKTSEAGCTIDEVKSKLSSIYSLVQTYPAKQYSLSPEAEEIYEVWFNQLDELRLKEDRQSFQAIYSKAKGNTGELALLLHLTNSAAMGLRITDDLISPHTMKAAIALMKFYIGQVKLIHSLGEEQQGKITPILAKIIDRSRLKGELSARDCKSSITALRTEDVAKIRGFFRDLVEGGYGVLTGSGDRVKFQATVDKSKTVDNFLSTPSTLEPVGDTEISADVTVDNLSTPSTPCTEPTPRQTVDTVDDFPLSNKSEGFGKGDRVVVIDPDSEWHLMKGVIDRSEGTNGSSQYYVEGENSAGRPVVTWLKGSQLEALSNTEILSEVS